MAPRYPWGHKSSRCIHCGQVGPRVVVLGGYAHRRCIPKPIQATQRRPVRSSEIPAAPQGLRPNVPISVAVWAEIRV